MQRKDFIKEFAAGAISMTTLSAFNRFTNGIKEQDEIMPVLFVGHGLPMNAIEDTEFSRRWKQYGK